MTAFGETVGTWGLPGSLDSISRPVQRYPEIMSVDSKQWHWILDCKILRCKRRKANTTLEILPLRPAGQRMVEDCPVILLSFTARSEILLCRKGHESFHPFFPLLWKLLLRPPRLPFYTVKEKLSSPSLLSLVSVFNLSHIALHWELVPCLQCCGSGTFLPLSITFRLVTSF